VRKNRTLGRSLRVCSVLVLAGVQPGSSQVDGRDVDSRWLPFLGCWEAVGAQDEIGLLCFSPAGGGVEVANYVDGEVSSIELLAGDGQARQVSAEGCEGWESLVFSDDGRRAFTTTEFLCGDSERRRGTGVMTFLSTTGWADVRALEIDGEAIAWVQEYELARLETLREYGLTDSSSDRGSAVRSARMAATSSITIDDVIEAASQVDDKAVETWVMLQGEDLRADARDLMALADVGASDDLIDAVVAMSNPEAFMVEVGHDVERYEAPPYPVHYRGYMSVAHYWGPGWGPSFGYAYSPYSPFYGSYGLYGSGYRYGYWGYRPGYVVVTPRSGRGGAVYRDGYRRGSDGTDRSARPRGSAPAASELGGAASQGSSGTTRTAKPRRRTSGGVAPSASHASSPATGLSRGSRSAARRVPPGPSDAARSRPARSGSQAGGSSPRVFPTPRSSRGVSRPSAQNRSLRPPAQTRSTRPPTPRRASTPRAPRSSPSAGVRTSPPRTPAVRSTPASRPVRPSRVTRRPTGAR